MYRPRGEVPAEIAVKVQHPLPQQKACHYNEDENGIPQPRQSAASFMRRLYTKKEATPVGSPPGWTLCVYSPR